MNKIYLLVVIGFHLFYNTSFGQAKSVKLFYDFEYLGVSTLEKENTNEALMRKAINKFSKNIQLELWYSNEKAIFFRKDNLVIEKDEVFQALLNFTNVLISQGTYYTHLVTNKQFVQNAVQDQKFIFTRSDDKQEWTLTNESKQIQNFTCYKATWIKNINGIGREITAWYTPNIPYKLGPKEYIGFLPGAILELHEPLKVYRCTYVEINKEKELKIKWPKDLETAMSEQEYHQKGKEFYNAITH